MIGTAIPPDTEIQTPAEAASDLPPLNLRKGEKECPKIGAIEIRINSRFVSFK